MDRDQQGPNVAPGIDYEDELEARATEKEIQEGDSTSVTELIVDHTIDDERQMS